jgi:hypothetical protein
MATVIFLFLGTSTMIRVNTSFIRCFLWFRSLHITDVAGDWILFHLMEYKWFFNFQPEHFFVFCGHHHFAFLFGALLRISLDHFSLLQREQERKNQQVSAELNLLKSQGSTTFFCSMH